jgi:hypothetical protein
MKNKILALWLPLFLTLSACGSNVETVSADGKIVDTSVEALTKENVEGMIETAIAESSSRVADNINSIIADEISSQLDIESVKEEIKQQIISELADVIKQEVSDYSKSNKDKQIDADALTKSILSTVNGTIDEKIAGLQLVQNVTYNTTEEVTRVEEKIIAPPVKTINDGDILSLSHVLPAEYEQKNGSKVILENFEVKVYNNRTDDKSNVFKYKMVATFNGRVEGLNEEGDVYIWIATGIGDNSAASAVANSDFTFSGEKTWEWDSIPDSFSVGNVTLLVLEPMY